VPKVFAIDDSFSKPARSALDYFQKWRWLLVHLQEICYRIGAKDLNSTPYKIFLQIKKLLALNG
jgi:hypothetical protein